MQLIDIFSPTGLQTGLTAGALAKLTQKSREWYLANILAALSASTLVAPGRVNLSIVPVCDTSIYAAGDVLFDATQIPNAVRTAGAACLLKSLALVDKDDNTAAQIDLFFLSANVSLGTFNAAPSITDANAVKILGIISVLAADFIDVGGSKVASKSALNLQLVPDSGTSLYVAAIARGTPTQTASGLVLNLGLEQQ